MDNQPWNSNNPFLRDDMIRASTPNGQNYDDGNSNRSSRDGSGGAGSAYTMQVDENGVEYPTQKLPNPFSDEDFADAQEFHSVPLDQENYNPFNAGHEADLPDKQEKKGNHHRNLSTTTLFNNPVSPLEISTDNLSNNASPSAAYPDRSTVLGKYREIDGLLPNSSPNVSPISFVPDNARRFSDALRHTSEYSMDSGMNTTFDYRGEFMAELTRRFLLVPNRMGGASWFLLRVLLATLTSINIFIPLSFVLSLAQPESLGWYAPGAIMVSFSIAGIIAFSVLSYYFWRRFCSENAVKSTIASYLIRFVAILTVISGAISLIVGLLWDHFLPGDSLSWAFHIGRAIIIGFIQGCAMAILLYASLLELPALVSSSTGSENEIFSNKFFKESLVQKLGHWFWKNFVLTLAVIPAIIHAAFWLIRSTGEFGEGVDDIGLFEMILAGALSIVIAIVCIAVNIIQFNAYLGSGPRTELEMKNLNETEGLDSRRVTLSSVLSSLDVSLWRVWISPNYAMFSVAMFLLMSPLQTFYWYFAKISQDEKVLDQYATHVFHAIMTIIAAVLSGILLWKHASPTVAQVTSEKNYYFVFSYDLMQYELLISVIAFGGIWLGLYLAPNVILYLVASGAFLFGLSILISTTFGHFVGYALSNTMSNWSDKILTAFGSDDDFLQRSLLLTLRSKMFGFVSSAIFIVFVAFGFIPYLTSVGERTSLQLYRNNLWSVGMPHRGFEWIDYVFPPKNSDSLDDLFSSKLREASGNYSLALLLEFLGLIVCFFIFLFHRGINRI